MSDSDDPQPEATTDRSGDPTASDVARPSTPPRDLEHVVSYGRLVNVLAAVTDRLAEKGYSVTEAQTRIVLQSLRDDKEAQDDPEDQPYRLGKLAERVGEVVGLDPSFVAAIIEETVETRDPY